MTGKGAHFAKEDTMIVFAKRLVDLFIAGAASRPMPMFWTF